MTQKARSKRPPRLVEGRDYFCGGCAGRERVYCPYCIEGCRHCFGGYVKCPTCKGGEVAQPPPEWV